MKDDPQRLTACKGMVLRNRKCYKSQKHVFLKKFQMFAGLVNFCEKSLD